MKSLRSLMLTDKKYSRLTRNVGNGKVNRSTTFPIGADAMIPGLANALGLNCNEAGRMAFVEFFERHLGKARAFSFRVACQLRDGLKSFWDAVPWREKAEILESEVAHLKADLQLVGPNGDVIIDGVISEFDGREGFPEVFSSTPFISHVKGGGK